MFVVQCVFRCQHRLRCDWKKSVVVLAKLSRAKAEPDAPPMSAISGRRCCCSVLMRKPSEIEATVTCRVDNIKVQSGSMRRGIGPDLQKK